MKHKLLQLADSHVSYTVYGSGQPLVLVHGFGEDSSVWEHQISALSGLARLIVPELPGTGQSSLLKGENISMDDYADSIHAVLEEEKVTECIMIGHSMGGYITLAFAEKYPGMLKSFGLFHSSALADDEEKKKTRKKGIDFIKTHGTRAFLETSTPTLFHDPETSKYQIATILDRSNNLPPETLVQYYEAMMRRPDRTSILEHARVPVLFILGEHDKAVPFDSGMKQVSLPPVSRLHILRDSGHMGMLEETEKVNSILADLLHSD